MASSRTRHLAQGVADAPSHPARPCSFAPLLSFPSGPSRRRPLLRLQGAWKGRSNEGVHNVSGGHSMKTRRNWIVATIVAALVASAILLAAAAVPGATSKARAVGQPDPSASPVLQVERNGVAVAELHARSDRGPDGRQRLGRLYRQGAARSRRRGRSEHRRHRGRRARHAADRGRVDRRVRGRRHSATRRTSPATRSSTR